MESTVLKQTFLVLGWLAALIFAGVAVEQHARLREQFATLSQLQQTLARIQAERGDVAQPRASAPSRSAAALDPAADRLSRALEANESGDPREGGGEAGDPEVAASGASPGSLESFSKVFAGLFEGIADDPAGPQARIQFETQYGELMDELGLDRDRAEALRVVLTDEIGRRLRDMTALFSSENGLEERTRESAREEVRRRAEERRALREELSQVLSADELALYDQYEAGATERNLRRQYGMQVGMYAPDLPAETRETLLRVLIDEDLSARERKDVAPAYRQIEVLDRAVERLDELLDPEEEAAVTRFLTVQYATAEFAAQMVAQRKAERSDDSSGQ